MNTIIRVAILMSCLICVIQMQQPDTEILGRSNVSSRTGIKPVLGIQQSSQSTRRVVFVTTPRQILLTTMFTSTQLPPNFRTNGTFSTPQPSISNFSVHRNETSGISLIRCRRGDDNCEAHKANSRGFHVLINEVQIPKNDEVLDPAFVEIMKIYGHNARSSDMTTTEKSDGYYLIGIELRTGATEIIFSVNLSQEKFKQTTNTKQFSIVVGSVPVSQIKFNDVSKIIHRMSPLSSAIPKESTDIIAILLLHIPNNKKSFSKLVMMKETGRPGFRTYLPIVIDHELIMKIREFVIDGVAYGLLCTPGQDAILTKLIPKFPDECADFFMSAMQADITQANKSFSRCADDNGPFSPASFLYRIPTPGDVNSCPSNEEEVTLDYPFPPTQGAALQGSAQMLALNTYYSITMAKKYPWILQGFPMDVSARILGISSTTLTRIKQRTHGNEIVTPGKKRIRKCPKQDILDSFDRSMIRSIVADLYKKGKAPLFDEIYSIFTVKRKQNLEHQRTLHQRNPLQCSAPDTFIHIGRKAFTKVLRAVGFKFGKLDGRAAVVQRNDIIRRRGQYLKRLRENRSLNASAMPLVYLDETWIDPHQRLEKAWVPSKIMGWKDRVTYSFPNHKIGRGPRLIVLGAAATDIGMISNVTEVYKVNKGKEAFDYHDNVNAEKFMQWFKKLLDYLDTTGKHFLIIQDNASYHTSRTYPKKNDKKKIKYDWLKSHENKTGLHIRLPEFKKVRVWELDIMIANVIQRPEIQSTLFKVDYEASRRGHQIVRLWPYGCDANPIELAWNTIKKEIKKQNIRQNLDDVQRVAIDVLSKIDGSKWNKYLQHVLKVEEAYWEQDGLVDKVPENIIIPLGMDDDYEDDIFEDYEKTMKNAIQSDPEINNDVIIESNGDIIVTGVTEVADVDTDDTAFDHLNQEYYEFIAKGGFTYEESFPMCKRPQGKKWNRIDFSEEGIDSNVRVPSVQLEVDEDMC